MRSIALAMLGAVLLLFGVGAASAAEYDVYTQTDPLRWQKPVRYGNEGLARSAAERQCIDRKLVGVGPNRAVKYVNTVTGKETILRCVDGEAQPEYR